MTIIETDAVASEAQAYSPGLKVKRRVDVKKIRKLPMHGNVVVKLGDVVDYDTVVAEVKMPGRPYILKAAGILNVDSEELESYLVKKVGDPVKENEVIAQCITMFGLIKKFVRSPIDGVVDNVSALTGRIIVRTHPEPISVNAYVPGRVSEIIEDVGAVIETEAAFIQGIFGVGGEAHGNIAVMVSSPEDQLSADAIQSEHKGNILVSGGIVTFETLKKAVELGVSGIISGGIKEEDLTSFIGHAIGVAITGEEEIGLTLIITEGFGKMAMSKRTFDLFNEFNGYLAHINGATQIRAGVQRPEIIIPNKETPPTDEKEEAPSTMRVGTPVRVIQTPYFGENGTVISLPINLHKVETEADVRVVEVELNNGKRVTLPRANIEVLDE